MKCRLPAAADICDGAARQCDARDHTRAAPAPFRQRPRSLGLDFAFDFSHWRRGYFAWREKMLSHADIALADGLHEFILAAVTPQSTIPPRKCRATMINLLACVSPLVIAGFGAGRPRFCVRPRRLRRVEFFGHGRSA